MSKIDLAAMTERLNQRIQDDPIITEAGRMRRGLDRLGARAGIAGRTARQTAADLARKAKDLNRPPGLDDPVDSSRRRFNRNAAIAAAAAAAPPSLQGALTKPTSTATIAGGKSILNYPVELKNLKNILIGQYAPSYEEYIESGKDLESLARTLESMSYEYDLGLDIQDPDFIDEDELEERVESALEQFYNSEKIRSEITPEKRPYVVMGEFDNPLEPSKYESDEIYRDGEIYRLPQKEIFRNYTIVIQRQPVESKDPKPVEITSNLFQLSKQYEMLTISAAEGTDAISNETIAEIDNTLDIFVEQALEQGLVVDWSNPENWVDAYVTNDFSKLKQTGARSVMQYASPVDSSIDADDTSSISSASSTVSPVFQKIVGELISQLAGRMIKSMINQPRSSDSGSEVDDIRTMKDRMDQLDALPAPGQDSEQELADQLTAELQQQLNRDLTAQEKEFVDHEVEKLKNQQEYSQ